MLDASMRQIATLLCALAVTLTSARAHAWLLPEHAEITRKALEDDVPVPLRDEIMQVVRAARLDAAHGRLPLCDTDTPLRLLPYDDMVGGAPTVTCIPYNALSAIAADHSLQPNELIALMTEIEARPLLRPHAVASMVVGTAEIEWQHFLSDAPRTETRKLMMHLDSAHAPIAASEQADPGSYARRTFTRDLDMRLQLVDHLYVSRAAGSKAHFQDAAQSLGVLLANAVAGDLNNALAQAMAHHVRSIELAARARGYRSAWGDARRTEALLEHAFALHFIQDAFAAGHMGTEHAMDDVRGRLRRHDFLNRNGIGATRALAATRCDTTDVPLGALPSCWKAQGDGYLDLDNSLYVEEATARVQIEFALALSEDPRAIVDAMRASDECIEWQAGVEKNKDATSCADAYVGRAASTSAPVNCDLWRVATLLDPTPTWTLPADRASWHRMSAVSADNLLACTLHALDTVSVSDTYEPADKLADSGPSCGSQPGVLPARALGSPLEPCALCADGKCTAALTAEDPANAACSTRAAKTRLGDPDVSLWRPLLTAWPTTQADVTTLEGQRDQFGQGFATQIAWGLAMHTGLAADAPAALAVELGGGISYRLDGILAGRINRPAAEFNVGISPMALSAADTRASVVAFAELRVPLPTFATLGVGYAFRASGLVDGLSFPGGIGPYGVRVYTIVSPIDRPVFAGWDVELAYLSLTRAFKVATITVAAPTETELRVRVGKLDLAGIGKKAPHEVPWSVSLELSGGWAWFL